SFGILCYQEDASKAAVALAGFSAADADGIRKALARKDPEARLQEYWPAFKAGAEGRGVDSGTIDAVWDMIRSFCGYSFVKAHSASYAMLSFKSAYLRCHHPAEFMAAVLSNHGGFYSTLAYVSECRRMGLEVLPPDVNNSELRCRGSGRTIRFGLEMIGSLRAQTASAIVDERRQHGAFASVEDFARRVPCSRSDAEALVGSGALDSVSPGATRAAKLMRILGILAMREAQADPRAGSSLFEEAQVAPLRPSTPSSPLQQAQQALPHQSAAERKRLESEMKYLGTTLAVHPTALWPRAADRPRIRGLELRFHVGQTVELLGWPIIVKQALTASDQLMEFVSFEDETALYETILFPESYQRYQSLLFEERPLFIRGKVEKDRGAITLNVSSIEKCPEGIGCNDGKIWIK
ncbi:MAG: DNA polymerase III subunit alpha, partial [Spirochaetaceae bacterium]|nr:DNA polymerase III subunit alpha [Spirochaetaceae bacterium]